MGLTLVLELASALRQLCGDQLALAQGPPAAPCRSGQEQRGHLRVMLEEHVELQAADQRYQAGDTPPALVSAAGTESMRRRQQADAGGERAERRGRQQGKRRRDPGRARAATHGGERSPDNGSPKVARDVGLLEGCGADPEGNAAEAD